MAFNSSGPSDLFSLIPKITMSVGIAVVTIALGILLGNEIYQMTGKIELQIAAIGCIVLVFSYLAWRILRHV